MRKKDVGEALLVEEHGLQDDAHAGPWHRQVSLLALESIEKMRAKGLDVGAGDFAENLTTEGIDLVSLPLGSRLKIGGMAVGEVTQIGKECHAGCAIFQQVGECVMPHEGVFAKVVRGGVVSGGDSIRVLDPVRVAVLTVSDKGARGEREDSSGAEIERIISRIGAVVERKVVPDEFDVIAEELRRMADKLAVHLILTTGGTGLSPRDVTPEATLAVLDRLAPGIPEAMRAASMAKTPHAMLSRAVAGTRGRVLIVNLPGSPRAVRECLEVLVPALPHAVATASGAGGECAR
ncbi:MAG TPA: molybdenum cofactor biosynthesis protein [Firmicutes bacterium]|nr:molybdenum cofactor biosynthesis protein [Bacillota bacterium]